VATCDSVSITRSSIVTLGVCAVVMVGANFDATVVSLLKRIQPCRDQLAPHLHFETEPEKDKRKGKVFPSTGLGGP
jgi:hypothetical protein